MLNQLKQETLTQFISTAHGATSPEDYIVLTHEEALSRATDLTEAQLEETAKSLEGLPAVLFENIDFGKAADTIVEQRGLGGYPLNGLIIYPIA